MIHITKQSFGYVLESGTQVTIFTKAIAQEGATPDIELYSWISDAPITFIPNQHIKEFKQKFIEVGGVIE